MKITLTLLFTTLTFLFSFSQGCTISTSNLTEISGDDGSGNCTYSIDILFTEGSGPDNGTLTFSSPNVTILTGAGPHSCACSGNTYTLTFEATCNSMASFTAFHDNSGNGNDCSVSAVGIPLPVTWMEFELTKETEDIIRLNWSTAIEVNNDFFEIEYSKNGIDFQSVTTIKGAGNSYMKTDYSYSHIHDFDGIVYYKIKQVDLDENYSYSEIRSINLQRDKIYTISPNPARETLYISEVQEEIIVHIFDIYGNNILTTTNTQIDIQDLENGIYSILIDNGSTVQNQQFIKVN